MTERQAPLLPPTIEAVPYQSRLWVAPGPNGFCLHFVRPRPNWWFQLWQYVFFGFIWEEIDV
jgi:hypothetical protein